MSASLIRRRLKWAACALLSFAISFAQAQVFPSRPVRVIVPFAPGGGTDNLTRIMAPVRDENRPRARSLQRNRARGCSPPGRRGRYEYRGSELDQAACGFRQTSGDAITGERRNLALPQVPTFAEAGLRGVDSGSYWVSLAPSASPQHAIQTLSAAMSKVLQAAEVRQRLVDLEFEPIGSTSDRCAENVRTEMDKWAKVVAAAGIRLQ